MTAIAARDLPQGWGAEALAGSAGPSFPVLTEASLGTPPAHWQQQSALQEAAALPLQRASSALEQPGQLCAAAVCLREQGPGERRVAAWHSMAVPAALRLPAGQGGFWPDEADLA